MIKIDFRLYSLKNMLGRNNRPVFAMIIIDSKVEVIFFQMISSWSKILASQVELSGFNF